jgi:hypothetical protein
MRIKMKQQKKKTTVNITRKNTAANSRYTRCIIELKSPIQQQNDENKTVTLSDDQNPVVEPKEQGDQVEFYDLVNSSDNEEDIHRYPNGLKFHRRVSVTRFDNTKSVKDISAIANKFLKRKNKERRKSSMPAVDSIYQLAYNSRNEQSNTRPILRRNSMLDSKPAEKNKKVVKVGVTKRMMEAEADSE